MNSTLRPPIPRLRHRPSLREDIAECMPLLPAWAGLDAATRAALPALWERLCDEPSVLSSITEDLTRPAGERLQSWGVAMIVPAAQAEAWGLDGEPRPGLVKRAYAALLDGSWRPMAEREIGRDNARGELRMLSMHYDMRERDLASPYVQSLLVMGVESYRAGLSGYNLRAMYFENHPGAEPWMLNTGYLRRPYAPGAGEGENGWPGGEPLLYFRLTREESRHSAATSTLRQIFDHHPPLFRLSPTQRRLLWLSLFDDHDETLMQRLQVSIHGLKKLWRGIYERIEDQMPDFFGDGGGADDGKRGPEKRRQVLAYVRQRLEELRPWDDAR
ncbi:hypothetical protein [Roseateles toxinivorans]|uniref:Uncharacterized protein n=1 Tax=Roseateles toxinivorans TaxID=270368 RepID=A0A4R6QLY2_9BURK|nr:hypothetical protein [Roseateles toxinivorans]TDP71116.1 hypothetical protein DES47_10394 [Roseateles toxinivorans]